MSIKANILQRLFTGHINVARVEYNELTEQFILHVISPGQLVEVRDKDSFVAFLTKYPLDCYLYDE